MQSKAGRHLLVGLIIVLISFSQKALASEDSTITYKRSFGYGVANLVELYDPTNYLPGIYVEFGQASPIEGWQYNIKLIGHYRYLNQNNIRHHEFLPFVVTVGLERKWELEKFQIGFNANLFYSMSLRKTSISPFQGDDYGFGISPGVTVFYPLRDNLVLCGGLEYGAGLFREFVAVGTVTTPALRLKAAPIRNLSFGIRHYF
jgi:hypothetical protein